MARKPAPETADPVQYERFRDLAEELEEENGEKALERGVKRLGKEKVVIRALGMLAPALALVGCYLGDPVYHFKSGVTEDEQQRDEDECMRIHRARLGLFADCMSKRGYMMAIGYKPKK